MAKDSQSNYSGLIKFAESHPELGRTKAISEYRKAGGHAQKKGGLKALAEEFNIKQSAKENRGKTIAELGLGGFYKPPVKIPVVKVGGGGGTPKKPKIKIPKSKKRNTVNLDLTSEVKKGGDLHYIDGGAIAVKTLKKNIKSLYGKQGNNFLQISLNIADDGYTRLNQFSLLFPYKTGTLQYDVQELGEDILKNLETYYSNLAKRYSNKAHHKLKNDVLETVKKIRKRINRFTNIKKDKMEEIFLEYGISINSYQVLKIVKTGSEEEE